MTIQGPYGDALQTACYGGSIYLADFLLDRGADVNAQGGPYGNALDVSCFKNQARIVELLLKRGADPNAQDGYFRDYLVSTYARGYKEVAQVAFDQGFKTTAQVILDQGGSQCQHSGQ